MARGRIPRRTKLNIPMCMAGVLFCLTLFSLHFSSGVIARYSANTDGTDNARVIEFKELRLEKTVSAGNYDGKYYVYPGAELEWNAAVSFDGSESATYVFVEVRPEVETDWNIPMTWTIDGTYWKAVPKTTDVFYLALAPNETLTDVPVFKDGKIKISTDVTAADLKKISDALDGINKKDFGIELGASVVQSNGFNSPKDAWTSLTGKHQTTFTKN